MLFKHKTIAHEKESHYTHREFSNNNVHVKVLATICTNKMNYMFTCRTICVRSLGYTGIWKTEDVTLDVWSHI